MKTELDKIKSTITISLGMKNRLRERKGNLSYEEFIAQLLRTRDEVAHSKNYLEIQQFDRQEMVYAIGEYKVIFTYNKYNHSTNFIFDIQIQTVKEKGKKIPLDRLYLDPDSKDHRLPFGYRLYFELLTFAIQQEIEPTFKHRGRFEDYYAWEKEFERLGLPKKTFDNDVMEKLNDYSAGVQYR